MRKGTRRRKVLIVDDDAAIRSVVKDVLGLIGYTVGAARNVTEASGLLGTAVGGEPYDLIIIDIGLPGMSGIDLLRRVRQELRLPVPVLMISGLSDAEKVREAAQLGIDGFIVKPFHPDVLEAKVRSCFESEHAFRSGT